MNDNENYANRLSDPDVVCLEVYGTEYIAIIWEDPEHGVIANLRFGSGRHHTVIRPDISRIISRRSVEGVNVVSIDEANELQ